MHLLLDSVIFYLHRAPIGTMLLYPPPFHPWKDTMSKADENVAVIPHSDVMRAKMPATPADFFWILFISFHVNHPLKIFNLFCQASRISCFVTQKYYPFFLPYGQTPILYTFQQGVLQQALLTKRRALWYLSVANVPDVPSCHQVFRPLRGCRLKQLFPSSVEHLCNSDCRPNARFTFAIPISLVYAFAHICFFGDLPLCLAGLFTACP